MNAAFEAAYNAADNPRIARNPAVVAARAAAKAAHANALDVVRAAQGADSFLSTSSASLDVSNAGYAASVAEVALREAIRDTYVELESGGR